MAIHDQRDGLDRRMHLQFVHSDPFSQTDCRQERLPQVTACRVGSIGPREQVNKTRRSPTERTMASCSMGARVEASLTVSPATIAATPACIYRVDRDAAGY
jgi:hypothetical protein